MASGHGSGGFKILYRRFDQGNLLKGNEFHSVHHCQAQARIFRTLAPGKTSAAWPAKSPGYSGAATVSQHLLLKNETTLLLRDAKLRCIAFASTLSRDYNGMVSSRTHVCVLLD
jgi:hypothetical protein